MALPTASDNVFPKVIMAEGAAPATPSSGQVKLYAKADGLLYSKDDAGTETLVSSGAGGLTDHDHTGGGDGGDLDSPVIDGYAVFNEESAPATASAATVRLYAKSDGLLYSKDDAGTETLVSGGAGGGSFSSYDTLISAMTGLVHRWKFEEASGNFADSVGSLTLTKSGTVTYAVAGGPVSGASGSITIGASGQGVSSGLGSIPVAGAARTFVIVYKGKSSSSRQAFISYGTSGSTRQWWTVNLNDNGGATADSLALATWSDDLAMTNSTLNVENWHMAAFGYDGTQTAYVWLDGHFYGKRLGGALNTGTGGNFFLGVTTGSADQLGAVTIDDLAVFSACLHGYQLQQLYNSLVGALP